MFLDLQSDRLNATKCTDVRRILLLVVGRRRDCSFYFFSYFERGGENRSFEFWTRDIKWRKLTARKTRRIFVRHICCFLNGPFPATFFLYFCLFKTVDSQWNLPMTGFEQLISGVGCNHSTNWATPTAKIDYYCYEKDMFWFNILELLRWLYSH